MTEQSGNGGAGETPLDAVLAVAERGDAEAMAFYDAFLNARLYVPTTEEDPAGEAGTVGLLVAEVEDEGFVPVFDTEARLTDWAERELPFTVLAGHTLVEQLDPELQIALNVGTEHFKLFVEPELKWLRARLGETVTGLETSDGAETAAFRTTEPPATLVEALRPALARNAPVAAAFLVEAEDPQAGRQRRWLLVLDVGDADEAVFGEAARDVGIAARAALGGDEYMDIVALNPLEGTGRALIAQGVTPIYARA